MGINIGKFIKNLKNVRENTMKLTKEEILTLYGRVLEEIAEKTIYDTLQARSVVIDEFIKNYGYNIQKKDLFSKSINHWGKIYGTDRGRHKGNSTVSDDINGDLLKVDLNWRDEGLYAQENANGGFFNKHEYPSRQLTDKRNNSQFEVTHISNITDNYMTYQEVQKQIVKIVKKLEEEMFKK